MTDDEGSDDPDFMCEVCRRPVTGITGMCACREPVRLPVSASTMLSVPVIVVTRGKVGGTSE